jgi:hypothetical protein
MPLALLTGGIVSGRAALAGVREAAAGRAAVRAKADIRWQLSARFIQLGYDPGFQGSPADLVVTATDGVEKLDVCLRRYLPQRILGAARPADHRRRHPAGRSTQRGVAGAYRPGHHPADHPHRHVHAGARTTGMGELAATRNLLSRCDRGSTHARAA